MRSNRLKIFIPDRLFRSSDFPTSRVAVQFSRLLALIVMTSLLLATIPPTRAEEKEVEVRFSFDQKIDDLWVDMPQISERPNVKLTSSTEPSCANAALRKARFALTQASIRAAISKAFDAFLEVVKPVLKVYGIGSAGEVLEIIKIYLESSSPEEFAKKMGEYLAKKAGGKAGGKAGEEAAKALYKKLMESKAYSQELAFDDPNCGRVTITIFLKPHPSKPDTPAIHLIASGDCQCKWPSNVSRDQQLGPWQVLAYAELTPVSREVKANTVEVTFGLGERQYEVYARCGCDAPAATNQPDSTPEEPPTNNTPPKENIVVRICEKDCGELYAEWIKWKVALERREADAANPVLMSDKETAKNIRESLDIFRRKAAEAKKAYYECLKQCYEKAVRAGEISKVPDEVIEEANAQLPPRKDEKKEGKVSKEKDQKRDSSEKDEKAKPKKGKVIVDFSDEVRKAERPASEKEKKEKDREEKNRKTSAHKKVSKIAAVADTITGVLSGRHRREKPKRESHKERKQ